MLKDNRNNNTHSHLKLPDWRINQIGFTQARFNPSSGRQVKSQGYTLKHAHADSAIEF